MATYLSCKLQVGIVQLQLTDQLSQAGKGHVGHAVLLRGLIADAAHDGLLVVVVTSQLLQLGRQQLLPMAQIPRAHCSTEKHAWGMTTGSCQKLLQLT